MVYFITRLIAVGVMIACLCDTHIYANTLTTTHASHITTSQIETPAPKGIFASIGSALNSIFSSLSKYVTTPEPDGTIQNNKTSSELIRKEATVSKELYEKYHVPAPATKASVDLSELHDKLAPLPKDDLSPPENTKNLPIRKKIKESTELDNMKTESERINEIDQKVHDAMPAVKLANTLATEEAADAPKSMSALEARLLQGTTHAKS